MNKRFTYIRLKRGITLLEVLIALTIISISLLSTWRAVNLTTNNYSRIQENLIASIIAKNILVEISLNKGINRLDTYTCQDGLPYLCKIQTKKTPNKYLYGVDILVYKDKDLITTLSTILPYDSD